jgi:Fic family protein
MRTIRRYIHQLSNWPEFHWNQNKIVQLLAEVRHRQGRLLGRMQALGFTMQTEANLETLTMDVLKTSEIEGEILNEEQVKSSIARKLGMDIAGLVPADRHVEGIVEMMLDATGNYSNELTDDRLFGWHAALFPTGRTGIHKIVVGAWRDNKKDDPMQVLSGAMGRETVHFEAPGAEVLEKEMKRFCDWFNKEFSIDPVMKAAIAHLWFVTIHPFDDGNGRIARAIADMQLCRADSTSQRFYSMSAQIRKERTDYYNILEETQKGPLDITRWMEWFLDAYGRALASTGETLAAVLKKAKFWEKHAESSFNIRQVLLLNKILNGFEGKLNSSKWAKIAKCSQDTALRDIQNLMDRKVLVKENSGGRSTSYILAD